MFRRHCLFFAVFVCLASLLNFARQASCSPSRLCGLRQGPSRIVGGSSSTRGNWPWQVEILQLSNDKLTYRHKCGGTLIEDFWVVTAAHCVFMYPEPQYYKIVLGQYNRSTVDPGQEEFNVSSVRIHESYMTRGYGFDIALLKLKVPVNFFSAKFRPACLPRQGQRIAVGTYCYITGWGKTSFNSSYAEVLQEARMPVVSYITCKAGNVNLFSTVDNETMLCAGYGGDSKVSGCHGDSGGPFVCQEAGLWVLRGAVSWGDHWCRAGSTYSVFARISTFVRWIVRTKTAPEFVQNPADCKDYRWYCGNWTKPTNSSVDGYCSHGWYRNFMKLYCPKSCGHCS